jgi:phosphoribosylglycinamide formyltransferase-1
VKIGIITYDHEHLKTEQLVCRYVRDKRIDSIEIFALPFISRKKREILINHRPKMGDALHTKCLAEFDKVNYQKWDGKRKLGSYCDLFIIGGAGILDVTFAEGRPIINAHSGIIPLIRGLDSFKWAIFNGDQVGVTLHLIGPEIDKGDILSIQYTPLFSSDTIETFARRHYELEINMLINFIDFLDQRVEPFVLEKIATSRMSLDTESETIRKFDDWKLNMLEEVKD